MTLVERQEDFFPPSRPAARFCDSDLAEFFRRAQETSRKGAEQGKDLLKERLAS